VKAKLSALVTLLLLGAFAAAGFLWYERVTE
jgi:hypothetical protein